MVSFISSSAACSSTSSSLAGASSLVHLLVQSSACPPKPSITGLGEKLITIFLKHFSSVPSHGSFDKDDTPMSVRPHKFLFPELVSTVRNVPLELRTLPVTAIESYQKGGENASLVPHRYAIITIQLPHGGSTYKKIQLQVAAGEPEAVLTAKLADDRSALVRPGDRRLAALEHTPSPARPTQRGPSLDALAELLDIIYKRTGRYEPCSRNCLWLADLVFFGCAMKFRKVWLAEGRFWPDSPIRRYLGGEIDVLAASAQCFLPEGAPGWMGIVYAALGRVFGAFSMQREVEEVVGKWQEYMEAVPVF
ncbi:hypothetical protein V8D89_007111 [Ganoderma adspersum]